MRKELILLSGLLLGAACAADRPETVRDERMVIENSSDLTNDQQRLSYALGVLFGKQIRIFQNLDQNILVIGLEQGYGGNETVLTDEELTQIIIGQQQLAMQQAGQEALDRGRAFLAANANASGVESLPNGIQYRILVEGNGSKPKLEDTIEVHYTGSLINGEVFDSSYERNQTAVFPLDGVIQGWQEVMPLMPVGSLWEVVIPSELAYGESGSGRIGPNEVLIFKINLLGIQN